LAQASVTRGPREGANRPIHGHRLTDTILVTMTDTPDTPAPVQGDAPKSKKPVRSSLKTFFKPQSVALIGATEKAGSVGRTILSNLIASPFGGTVYPVNPKRPSVLGIQAHKSISSIPEKVDLAVIVTPPRSIPGIIEECGEAGVPTAVVI
jgi:acetyltransferase